MAVWHVEQHLAPAVLITGATGFTGSSLVEAYAGAGWNVHGTYRDEPDDLDWLPEGVVLHHLDLLDSGQVDHVVDAVRPEVAHHMAALSSVAASWDDPLGTLNDNARMQYHLLEALLRHCPQCRTIVAGSCDEYGLGQNDGEPIGEDWPLLPATPYGLSKVVQDLMGFQYAAAHRLRVIRVRSFLQLGPRRASNFVAGSFARQVAEIEAGYREPVIEVGNIDLKRDFTDVRDVARACVLLANLGTAGEAYNIASGEAHSLREMLAIMLAQAGIEAEIRQLKKLMRGYEPDTVIGDASKLRGDTGWAPDISFEQSAADTLDYWRVRLRQGQILEGETV